MTGIICKSQQSDEVLFNSFFPFFWCKQSWSRKTDYSESMRTRIIIEVFTKIESGKIYQWAPNQPSSIYKSWPKFHQKKTETSLWKPYTKLLIWTRGKYTVKISWVCRVTSKHCLVANLELRIKLHTKDKNLIYEDSCSWRQVNDWCLESGINMFTLEDS